MELKEFIQDLAEQFEETDNELITADCKFQELEEWSSLTTLAIIAFVKTNYNKTVTTKEIRSCQTAKELFDLVNNK